jgi:hypothetical protein
MTKNQSVSMLSALLASHYGQKKISAFTAADTAIKLNSLANSIMANEVWHCNGYKGEYEDAQMRKMTTEQANAYQSRIWNDGADMYEKRKEAQKKRLAKIVGDLPLSDFLYVGLYGGLQFTADNRTFIIGAK